jgi:hypothetical protein
MGTKINVSRVGLTWVWSKRVIQPDHVGWQILGPAIDQHIYNIFIFIFIFLFYFCVKQLGISIGTKFWKPFWDGGDTQFIYIYIYIYIYIELISYIKF